MVSSLDLGSLVRLIWAEMLHKRPLIFEDGVAVRAREFVHVTSMTQNFFADSYLRSYALQLTNGIDADRG